MNSFSIYLKKCFFLVKSLGKYSAVLLPAEELTDPEEKPKWIPELDDSEDDQFYEEPVVKEPKPKKSKNNTSIAKKSTVKSETISDDSEEDETFVLDSTEQVS